MLSDASRAPNTEPVTRPSAMKTLRRFFLVAWRVSPFGTIIQSLLTLIHGCIPVGTLWASRGLVNLIVAILANETEPSLQTAAPWVIALVLLSILRNITGTYDGYLRWKMQNLIKLYQQRELIEAATHIDFAAFDQPQTYDLIQRARQALDHRLTNFLRFLTEIGQLCVTLVGYGVLLWVADPLLRPGSRVTRNSFRLVQSKSSRKAIHLRLLHNTRTSYDGLHTQFTTRFIIWTGSPTLWAFRSFFWALA